MRTIRFGIIGCGLMGREFASAAARWGHLLDMPARPEIVAICNRTEDKFDWFRQTCPALRQTTTDYRALLNNTDVDAAYVALPHHLHREVYTAAIRAGKHLMGEKPFGIDKPANDAILAEVRKHPNVLVRCVSQHPFFPGVQKLCGMIESGAFGRIIEVSAGFLHSSDLDPNKPINWKRTLEFNGEYGCMGDLGMHACHVPFRAGWTPKTVRAVLRNIVPQRPDGKGNVVPCETWDNATLLTDAIEPVSGDLFPLTLRTHRIAPGQRNTWYVEVLGTQASARWSSLNPKLLEILEYRGGSEQNWQQIQTGYEPAFRTITGPIFEFGFTDAIQQMWAAFVYELTTGKPLGRFSGCVTPEETALSHRLFTAALRSHRERAVAEV